MHKKIILIHYLALTNKFIMLHNVSSLHKQGINVFLSYLYFLLILPLPQTPCSLSKWVRIKDNTLGLICTKKKKKCVYTHIHIYIYDGSGWKYIINKVATSEFKRKYLVKRKRPSTGYYFISLLSEQKVLLDKEQKVKYSSNLCAQTL